MQYIYLQRKELADGRLEYTYHFDDHGLSPNNLVLRNLFYTMLDTAGPEVDTVEVEYSDTAMAKQLGINRAVEWLQVMGAADGEQKEYWKEGVLLSRTFCAAATPERLAYLHAMKELDEVYRIRLLGDGDEKIHLYFAKTLSLRLDRKKEEIFLQLLLNRNVPHKIL
ncbi:hypothetical protein PP175_18720 [Aneurinibacillus sp. Ricciae_BoGa-3]|uniref:hypothetical protein n=1 Tax=Aneurinibacillus sp. Ricciae_BoGa-3 TaxID=3022697 RepID=UPI00233FD724|nr:hypothetical protein [Aneurinibacillus sp. Ricciae_BoGa-3]WCK53370.1 hypothetical protein PP175_18720 [Aneurinibacillus sp. Ricciae_BoGa-3]